MTPEPPKNVRDYDGASIPELTMWLDDDAPGVRANAVCALGDRLRTREIDRLDPPVIEKMASLLNDKDTFVRFEAAIALADAHDGRARDELLRSCRDRNRRLDAIRALGILGDTSAIPELGAMLKRFLFPWADRLQAAAALCALGDRAGADYLEERLKSRKFAERAAAVHFIGECKHPGALALLSAIAGDPKHPLCDTAVRALGLLGDRRAVPILKGLRASAGADLAEDIDAALKSLARASRAPSA